MSKMSNLHAETAPERAESAENEVEFLRSVMKGAATSCRESVAIVHEFAGTNIIGTDLIARLNGAIESLEMASKRS